MAGRAVPVQVPVKVRPHKVRGWLRRADDPGNWVRAGRVCRLYLNPPPGTVLISLDEKTAMQARSRKHRGIPLQPEPQTALPEAA